MTGEDVDIPMETKDYEGDIEKRTVQTGSRVKIPEEWLDYLGLDEGDEIALVCGEDDIQVIEWELDKIKEL